MGKCDDLVAGLRTEIAAGTRAPGSRLLSIRSMAREHRVSKTTVVLAYDRLVAEGRVLAERGSGFRVLPPAERSAAAMTPTTLEQAVDSVSLLKAQLDRSFDLRVGDGRPPRSWTSGALPRQLPLSLWRDGALDGAGYGSAFGDFDLRERITLRQSAQGVATAPDRIVTTFGANHALDLVIRRYLAPGMTVLVDDPGYYPLFAKLRLAGIVMIGVRRGDRGPDLDDFAIQAKRHRPAMFFTQSRGQNPTGTSMDARTAHGVLAIAQAHRMMVVDDDPFIDLPGMTGTRLAVLDAFGLVVTVGTYAKLLHAGLRSGYVMASQTIAAELAEIKMLTCVNSSRLSEAMIAQTMSSRRYDRHLVRYAQRLQVSTATVLEGLTALGLAPVLPPGGGLYAWIELPPHIDESTLAETASRSRIFLAPGRIFRPKPSTDSHAPVEMRINLARAANPKFFAFLSKALDCR